MTMKAGIDQGALIEMFSEASAKQGEALRKAVSDATLRALQGRELTLDNIKKVVKNVAAAASTGVARNPLPALDAEAMLGKALAGIDAALLKAVDANRKALEQFVSGGVSLAEKPLRQAIANVEKMEDVFFAAVAKTSESAGPLQAPWQQALDSLKLKGSATGMHATETVAGLMSQAQTMLRANRATGLRAAQAMLDSYAAMASGVLIGMSEGMQAGSKAAAAPAAPAPSSAPVSSATSTPPKPARKATKSPARKRAARKRPAP